MGRNASLTSNLMGTVLALLVVVAVTAVHTKPSDSYKSVEYVADHHKGFQANVDYKGKAQYPQKSGPAITFKPSGGYDSKPKPAYH
ncbi:hypothetical protein Pcinc_029387 [Petrolisthes cinctipes]|uniref:Uncharacterized protein n=1 Tax=Petrolisthes cinctipes TaxID=88211 RepID=A0AAE1K7V8_PETCI|nr:hypothetical protein Pcinc_029387 [Petrolisthes cinctipes]